MLMSLLIVMIYYSFIVLAKALSNYPDLQPNLVLWLPLIVAQGLGLWLMKRSS